MPTNDDDLDSGEDEFEWDWSRAQIGRYAPRPGQGLEIAVDGAVEYSLRIIPSNKVVGRFSSTLEAWPSVLAQLDRGIPARLLCLDWHGANGETGPVGSGSVLAHIARRGARAVKSEKIAAAS